MAFVGIAVVWTADGADWPDDKWSDRAPTQSGLDVTLLKRARDYALTGGGSGIIVYRGQAVMRWGNQQQTYDLKSGGSMHLPTKWISGNNVWLLLFLRPKWPDPPPINRPLEIANE